MKSRAKKTGLPKRAQRTKTAVRLKTPPLKKSSAARRKAVTKAAPNPERDRVEILGVSKMWWDANRKFSIPMMCEAFVGGDKFHGFNLNGHTYYGIDEWVKLWEYLANVMAPGADDGTVAEPHNVRLLVRGDMAVLTAESALTVKVLPTSIAQSAALPPAGETARIPFRATEVFVREDHEGSPVWKMWHFHCSPRAPEGEPRMGF